MLKVKGNGWKRDQNREWPANSKEQKAGLSTLISNKMAFHTKCIIKDEWHHVMMMKDSTHREDGVILSLDALLKSVTFSLPSVSPLEFSFPSARDFRHAPCSSFSTQQPVWPSHYSDGSSYNAPIPECGVSVQCRLVRSVPALPTSAPSQPLRSIVSSGLQSFGCATALVWSGLPSPTRLVSLNALSSGSLLCLPSSGLGPLLFWL